MGNNCSCFSNKNYYQEWPTKGTLKENMNLSLRELNENISTINTDGTKIFMYKMTTVRMEEGRFIQTGSGPNFQGDKITICTCKQRFRACNSRKEWENRWVAGFTNKKVSREKIYLFYLMKVEETYISQKDIFDSLSNSIVNKKNSRYNRLGDIYQPKPDLMDQYNPEEYYEPSDGHPHKKDCHWHGDIHYKNKKHLMLVGNPNYSFLWSKPKISRNISTDPRNKISKSLNEFLGYLLDV